MPRVWAHRKLTICYVTAGFFPWSFLQDKNLSKNIFSFLGHLELQKNQYYSGRLYLFLRPSQFRCKELKKKKIPPTHTCRAGPRTHMRSGAHAAAELAHPWLWE